jgi:hypothetical protein
MFWMNVLRGLSSFLRDVVHRFMDFSNIIGLQAWEEMLAQLNCSNSTGDSDEKLACMRNVDAGSIQSASASNSGPTFTIVNDDVTQLAYAKKFTQSNVTKEEVGLGMVMQGAWANFAKDSWVIGPGWPRVYSGVDSTVGYAVAAVGSLNRNPSG